MPLEIRQEVPRPGYRTSPPFPTMRGGHPVPVSSRPRRRVNRNANGAKNGQQEEKRKYLNILQWNAEGLYRKTTALKQKLATENIHVACIQETHLNPNHRLSVRGYTSFRMDREGHKGGVLILVKNNIAVLEEYKVDTNQQSEINGVKIRIEEKEMKIYNIYSPQDKELSLQTLDITGEDCLVIGDMNSHSTSWGYEENDRRGDEVEDWQIETDLLLLNDPEDPPTYFSRRWLTTTSPDIAFATENIASKTSRIVSSQLAGSDHKPVLLSLDLNLNTKENKPIPRWNYKKADWEKFSQLTDKYTQAIVSTNNNINRPAASFDSAILKAAAETIPRGARKNYKPYWTEELQAYEDDVTKTREEVEKNPTVENNIAFKRSSAKCRKEFIQAARKSWKEKTESLNFEKDSNKLWKLAKSLNNEDTLSTPITIEKDETIHTGKMAANCLIENYEQQSDVKVPQDRKREIQNNLKNIQPNEENTPDFMKNPFTLEELSQAKNSLKLKKSPGPDKVTNEMLLHLGPKANSKLLQIYNNSWKSGNIPQSWREATMIPVLKKGKHKNKATSYRPISLLSCTGKLMERMVNTRLTWHLESKNILVKEQAGFRQNMSTEDQVTYIAQKIEDGFQNKQHTLTVWVDMEKAFDKVWKDGLRYKLRENGVSDNMYKWISQYLYNRTARVRVEGEYSREKVLREGVPQGGVLSPTLFLVFINDIMKDMPKKIQGAIYADDLVLWCSEEHLNTARYRMQEALNVLDRWTKKWLVKLNSSKTTYTIFSLSTLEQNKTTTLQIDGENLEKEDYPIYLGITFDPRLTWKQQTEKAERRGKIQLNLMRKIAGSTWGADHQTLKNLYTGSVRPTLEYGIQAWGNTTKAHFDRVNRVQNQATRIITGAIKSTPIVKLEESTGLQSLKERKETKVLMQAAKFQRMPQHPMNSRLKQYSTNRLQSRTSFVKNKSTLLQKHPDLHKHAPKEIPNCLATPLWQGNHPRYKTAVPNIKQKDLQSELERKAITSEYLDKVYPREEWIRTYTDGSAEDATRNGGAGVFIQYPQGSEDSLAFPTGSNSTNYKSEAIALEKGANHLGTKQMSPQKIVFLSDAQSVIDRLKSYKDKELNNTTKAICSLCEDHEVVVQWIPSHCGLYGNDKADFLAKTGSSMNQMEVETSYGEEKTHIKRRMKKEWANFHPNHNTKDPYYQLTRREQVTIFRLRTGHNRLKRHLHHKFRIGETDQCPCGTDVQDTNHVLQMCPLLAEKRSKLWPTPVDINTKLYGSLTDLQRTANFIADSELTI